MIIIIYNSRISLQGALICVSIRNPVSFADLQNEQTLVPDEYGLHLSIRPGSPPFGPSFARNGPCMLLPGHRIQKVGGHGMIKIVLHARALAFATRPTHP